MSRKRPIQKWTDETGRFKINNIVCFMVVDPEGWPIYPTCRRKMKDACMAFEEMEDRDWDAIAADGFRVMKLFAGGYDRTDQALLTVDDWVVDLGGEFEVGMAGQ